MLPLRIRIMLLCNGLASINGRNAGIYVLYVVYVNAIKQALIISHLFYRDSNILTVAYILQGKDIYDLGSDIRLSFGSATI